MRKSGRLASIHEDDDSNSNSSSTSNSTKPPTAASSNTKKFTPTIPTVRRKKVVEEDQQVEAETVQVPTVPSTRSNQTSGRRPLHTPAPANVSGPLSLGPASMPRSSSRASANSGGLISARSLSSRSSHSSSSASASNPLSDSVPIEDEFSSEATIAEEQTDNLLKPVVLIKKDQSSSSSSFVDFDSDKLFLFQMPPILPTLLNHQTESSSSTSSPSTSCSSWPASAQGRYGKLRRYKSGRLVLILENSVEFLLNSSIESATEAQNTCVLAIDPEFGQSFNLGAVQAKFVAVPEFEKFQKLTRE